MRGFAAVAAGVLTLAALGYATAALRCTRSFARRNDDVPVYAEPVSVLVPLFGDEPGLEENLRALVAQDHPAQVQVVCGVHDAADAALAVAEAVRAAFPDRVTLSVGAPRIVANPKVANLIAMSAHVRHETLVLVDSDMRVDAAYVRTVTAPLADPTVGAVTTLYGARSNGSVTGALGAAFVNEQFAPAALVSAALGPLRHAYGATIALRRSTLAAAGGFAALGPHLADDHVLGRAVTELGLRVVLSRYVPHTFVGERDLGALVRHELRWHRTIRAVAPGGYAGLILTYPVPLAFLTWMCAPRRWESLVLVVAAFAVRVAVARSAARALRIAPLPAALVPLRDALGLAVWACGLRGGSVEWRGEPLQLREGDALAR
jgi:ceramide glucosyltransferase